jgi:hypothetical protein
MSHSAAWMTPLLHFCGCGAWPPTLQLDVGPAHAHNVERSMKTPRELGPLVAFSTFLVLIVIVATSHAQMPQVARFDKVTRIDVVEYGIYRSNKTGRTVEGGPTTGFYLADLKLIAATRNIPAQQGVQFGFRYAVVGPSAGTVALLRFVTVFPAPGLRNPATQQITTHSEYEGSTAVGSVSWLGYEFTNAWEATPGIWTMQLWYQGRPMVEQQFVVVRE